MNTRLTLFFALGLVGSAPDVLAAPSAATLPAPWLKRLDALSAPTALEADFVELRYTPLKKKPVEARGVVRLARARGLSLAYDQTRAPVIILDSTGLLLRHSDGREQSAPPEAEPDLRLLHALFAFDLATLDTAYELRAEGAPDAAWTLLFTRRPEATASYRELVLRGDASRLTGILLVKTPNLRTEITVSAPRALDAFSADDLARYFR
jgi:hypothetical protein